MEQAISSIMHPTISPVSMDDTVEKVEAMMKAKRISTALVYDHDGAILGIITSTDLVKLHTSGKDPRNVHAWEICTYRPIEVTPDTPMQKVAELMIEHKTHHAVAMENEKVQGIVSSLDFVKLLLRLGKARGST